ncbi:MAG: glycosyltransferase [Bacilli bacterium]
MERKKLKVAVVADVLGKENNGTTIAGMNFIRSLRAKGHEVIVISPDKDKKDEPGHVLMPSWNFGVFNRYVAKNGVVIARVDAKLLEETLKEVDVVHSMLPFSLGKATARITKRLGIPLTCGFHTQAENITGHIKMMNLKVANRFTYKVLNKRLYKHADGIHYPTTFSRDTFEAVVGKTPAYVISNGVNKRFQYIPELKDTNLLQTDAKYQIIFTGRLSKEKTHHILIKALKYSKYKDDIQLVFAGAGPLENKLRKMGRKLKYPPIIRFFTREEMVEVLNNATLYVHPSEIEIEAISCLEAISSGLVPVIANSKRSATRYFALDDNNLFKNLDAKDLASKIDYWLDNPQKRDERRAEYFDYTKKFDHDYCMDQMEEMLYNVIANGKRKA